MNLTFLIFILGFAVALLFGLWARSIAVRKNRVPLGWFLAGLFLMPLGVLIVYLMPVHHATTPGVAAPARSTEREMPARRGPAEGPRFKRCHNCGAQVPVDALACGHCGESLGG